MRLEDVGLRFVERDTAEWDYMWAELGAQPCNKDNPQPTVCFNDDAAEVWQYMGTARMPVGWFHEFRHRAHPSDGMRKMVRIPVKGGK